MNGAVSGVIGSDGRDSVNLKAGRPEKLRELSLRDGVDTQSLSVAPGAREDFSLQGFRPGLRFLDPLLNRPAKHTRVRLREPDFAGCASWPDTVDG